MYVMHTTFTKTIKARLSEYAVDDLTTSVRNVKTDQ